ncbi:hypothetical protein [Catellatospora paridis]|uniref:hypothetical protein n=1 Tax=Catellatospora paridis TaxID=1617086 RepID=UPI0012D4370B|nr:hypothetical protein [Catellatospora paridis]
MADDAHPRLRRSLLLAAASVALLAPALTCPAAAAPATGATRFTLAAKAASPCNALTKFKRSHFADSARIDNKRDPLPPGTRFVLDGQTAEGPHRVVLTVTDLVKRIDGVWTRVLWDQDLQGDPLALVESELAFHAQDKNANVWVLGEYPEEFEAGVFTGAPNTWISGAAGARGGVLVPGKPRKGGPFLQGFAPAIDFLDCGQVVKTRQDDVCAGGVCYDDVTQIREFSPLDPDGGSQLKFYAPGVGNIKITAEGDPEGEFLDLASRSKLSPEERIRADLAALRLERRAYKNSKVYRTTSPMLLWPGDPDTTKVRQAIKAELVRR